MSFEHVSDEWIEKYNIEEGNFDNVSKCEYDIPSYTAIGKVYQMLILNIIDEKKIAETIKEVFSSFIVDAVSNFNSGFYYSNPDYIEKCYESGEILDD